MAGEAAIHDTSAQALFLLFLVPVVVLLIGGKKWSRRRTKQQLNLPLPPSPPGNLPVIGHLHLVGSLPHVSFRDLAWKHGPDLMLLRLGAVNTVVVSSPRAAEAVLRTHDHAVASRARSAVADIILYGSSDVGFAPYGQPWQQARKVVATHMLSARKVRSFRHGREEEVRIAVAKIRAAASGGTVTATAVDMSEHLNSYANDVLCRAVLAGHDGDDGRNKLVRELTEINMSLLGGFNLEDYFPGLAMVDALTGLVVCPRAKRVRKRWDELFDKLIDEQGRHCEQEDDASSDFIQVLLSVQEEYGLTTDNVKAILIDMFDAGIETTYLVLEFAMAELMNNRHVMAKLQAEVRRRRTRAPDQAEPQQDVVTEEELGDMAYLKATVKETLRLHPPGPLLIPHLSMADCEIDGYTIPAGTRIMVNVWALARDPASWETPEEFAPERFLPVPGGSAAAHNGTGKEFDFLPFGSGRRICPGINFANAAVKMMLANLVYHFDWELPAEMKEVDMKEVFSLSIRRKEKLLLVPIHKETSPVTL